MTENSWRAMYLVGAVAAIAAVAGLLFDIGLAMVPGWETTTAPANAHGWLTQLSATPWLGLRNLDLLNVVVAFAGLPMYVALLGVHRKTEPALALLALLVVGLGTVLFTSNNIALPMLELSSDYSGATPAEKALLAAAAESLLARGAHGSIGAFPGFLLSEAGTLLMAAAMLRGRVFRPVTAWLGILGTSLLGVYSVAMTFFAVPPSLAAAFAAPGGLLVIAWQIVIALGLIRLARRQPGSSGAAAAGPLRCAPSRT